MAKKKNKPQVVAEERCPVCGGKGLFVGAPGKDGLCECEGCKLVFVGSLPSRQFLADERNQRFKGSWDGVKEGLSREEAGIAMDVMCGYFALTKKRQAPLNGFDLNVLDAMCGLGLRIREFQKYGWEVYGLDPSKEAVEYAQGCFLDAKQGWFDEGKKHDVSFDLVVFHGSFGCLPRPLDALEWLRRVLRHKGLVHVDLAGEPVATRLFHYNGETLRRLFMENGFTVLKEGETDKGPFAWFCRKGDRRKPKVAKAEALLTAGMEV